MKKFLLPVFMAFIFAGCVSSSPEGYTLSVSPQTLQENVAKEFPIQKDLAVGSIKLQEPKIGLKEGSDRMQTAINFTYKPPFLSAQTGTIDLSGQIKYDKKRSAFYLLKPEVDELKFNETSLTTKIFTSIKSLNKGVMQKVIDGVFQQFPIYKLAPNTLSGKLLQKTVKDAKIKNGQLLITFGMPE